MGSKDWARKKEWVWDVNKRRIEIIRLILIMIMIVKTIQNNNYNNN